MWVLIFAKLKWHKLKSARIKKQFIDSTSLSYSHHFYKVLIWKRNFNQIFINMPIKFQKQMVTCSWWLNRKVKCIFKYQINLLMRFCLPHHKWALLLLYLKFHIKKCVTDVDMRKRKEIESFDLLDMISLCFSILLSAWLSLRICLAVL